MEFEQFVLYFNNNFENCCNILDNLLIKNIESEWLSLITLNVI